MSSTKKANQRNASFTDADIHKPMRFFVTILCGILNEEQKKRNRMGTTGKKRTEREEMFPSYALNAQLLSCQSQSSPSSSFYTMDVIVQKCILYVQDS